MAQGGLLNIRRNGKLYKAEGHFDYNLGVPKKEPVLGSNGEVIDFTEVPQANFIKGNIFITKDDSIEEILKEKDLTVVLELNNGKVISLSGAFNTSEGTVNSEKNIMPIELVGKKAREA